METKDQLKTVTIKEALSYPEGTPIQRITGKVSLVWDRTGGEGKWGAWTKQSGIMEDEQGNKILFTAWGKPDMADFKGRMVIFRSSGGKKPSIEIKPDFKDASKMTLNVGKSAFVLTEEEDTDDIPMSYGQPENKEVVIAGVSVPKPQQTSPKAIVEPKKAIPEDGLDQVRHRLMQYSNLRKLCDKAANVACIGMDESDIKDVGTSFWIQGMKEGLEKHMPDSKPIDNKAKKNDPEEEDPEFLPAEEF